MPVGNGVLLSRNSSRAQVSATRAAIASLVTSQVCGSGSGDADRRPGTGAGRGSGSAPRPRPDRAGKLVDHVEPRHECGQDMCGQVERPQRQAVRRDVAEGEGPVERGRDRPPGRLRPARRIDPPPFAPRGAGANGSPGQLKRLPPTLITTGPIMSRSFRFASSGSLALGTLAREHEQGMRAPGTRGDGSPGLVQPEDRAARLDDPLRQPAGEELARTGDDGEPGTADRRAAGPAGRVSRRASSASSAARAKARASSSMNASRSVPIIRARRSRGGLRRGAAVGRREVLGVRGDLVEGQVDVEGRGEQLGRQPGRHAAIGSSVARAQTGVRRTPA